MRTSAAAGNKRSGRRRGSPTREPVMRTTMMPASLMLLTGCLIVLTSLPITSTDAKQSDQQHRTSSSARNAHLSMHETATDVDQVYTFDQLWSLLYQDVTRWMAILEDVIAETIRTHFFNGLVDRKTIKRALRAFTQNALIMLREQGYFESSHMLLSSLPPLTHVH